MLHRYSAVCALVLPLFLHAQSGTIDPTFGTAGLATLGQTTADDEAKALVIQPDGKPVIAGFSTASGEPDLLVARYNTDGTPDNSFGTGGRVVTDAFDVDVFWAMALAPDGKIVAAGLVNNSTGDLAAVARYNTNGSLDVSFGGTGIVALDLGTPSDRAWSVAVQPDGAVIITGSSNTGGNDFDPFLVRLLPNGTLDNTFSDDGILITDDGPDDGTAYAVLVQPDGRILQAGFFYDGTRYVGAVRRFLANGTVDSGFNGTGTVSFPSPIPGADVFINSLVLTGDGIVAVGSTGIGADQDFAACKLNMDGSLATAFGTGEVGGVAVVPFGTGDDQALGVDQLPDGRLLLAGFTNSGLSSYASAAVLLSATGTLVDEFNGDGRTVLDVAAGDDILFSCKHDAEGRLLVAGYLNDGHHHGFVARMLGADDVGITETGGRNTGITAFPSPTAGPIDLKGADVRRVQVFNAAGSLVRSLAIGADQHLSLEGLPAGCYALRAFTAQAEPLGTVHVVKE